MTAPIMRWSCGARYTSLVEYDYNWRHDYGSKVWTWAKGLIRHQCRRRKVKKMKGWSYYLAEGCQVLACYGNYRQSFDTLASRKTSWKPSSFPASASPTCISLPTSAVHVKDTVLSTSKPHLHVIKMRGLWIDLLVSSSLIERYLKEVE